MSKRELKLFLQDIAKMIALLEQFTTGIEFEAFAGNAEKQAAVTKMLENIGEAVKQIPKEIRELYPAIPWSSIAGMRDILVHHYWDVDLETTWQVIQVDLPLLKVVINELLNEVY
jgi:uncharacterized protein with HEPN domain